MFDHGAHEAGRAADLDAVVLLQPLGGLGHARQQTGVLAQASANLKFFGLDGGNGPSSEGIKFNIEPTIFLQQLKFRIKNSDFWAGINYLLLDSTIAFNPSAALPIEIPDIKFDSTSASVSLLLDYDSRDTLFTPSNGLSTGIKASFYREAFGSDNEFEKYKVYAKFFTRLTDSLVLGLRGDVETLNGDARFYEYPFISMRGIPAMRYQGETVGVAEAEFRWNFTTRWSLILFGGVGEAQSADFVAASVSQVKSQCGNQVPTPDKRAILILAALNITSEFFELKKKHRELLNDINQRSEQLLDTLETQLNTEDAKNLAL